jgi:hypothetical protein
MILAMVCFGITDSLSKLASESVRCAVPTDFSAWWLRYGHPGGHVLLVQGMENDDMASIAPFHHVSLPLAIAKSYLV